MLLQFHLQHTVVCPTETPRACEVGEGASVRYYFFHRGQILYCRPAMYPKRKRLPGTHRQCPTVSKVKGLPPVAESDIYSPYSDPYGDGSSDRELEVIQLT